MHIVYKFKYLFFFFGIMYRGFGQPIRTHAVLLLPHKSTTKNLIDSEYENSIHIEIWHRTRAG